MDRAAPPSDGLRCVADRRAPRRPRRAARLASVALLALAPAFVQATGPAGGVHVGGVPAGGVQAQPYPADWPALAGMSARCTELSGQYLDPMPPDRGGAPSRDGVRYGAGAALGLASQLVRADDPLFTLRHFALEVRGDGGLEVRYALDGAEVTRRTFPGSAVTCGPDGLSLTAFERPSLLPPKTAIRGPDLVHSTLYRVGGHLYVKTAATTRIRVLGVLPMSSTVVVWQRFAAEAH